MNHVFVKCLNIIETIMQLGSPWPLSPPIGTPTYRFIQYHNQMCVWEMSWTACNQRSRWVPHECSVCRKSSPTFWLNSLSLSVYDYIICKITKQLHSTATPQPQTFIYCIAKHICVRFGAAQDLIAAIISALRVWKRWMVFKYVITSTIVSWIECEVKKTKRRHDPKTMGTYSNIYSIFPHMSICDLQYLITLFDLFFYMCIKVYFQHNVCVLCSYL